MAEQHRGCHGALNGCAQRPQCPSATGKRGGGEPPHCRTCPPPALPAACCRPPSPAHCRAPVAQEAEEYFGKWGDTGVVDLMQTFSDLIILTASRTLLGERWRAALVGARCGGACCEPMHGVANTGAKQLPRPGCLKGGGCQRVPSLFAPPGRDEVRESRTCLAAGPTPLPDSAPAAPQAARCARTCSRRWPTCTTTWTTACAPSPSSSLVRPRFRTRSSASMCAPCLGWLRVRLLS